MSALDELRATGAAVLGAIPRPELDAAVAFLKSRPVYPNRHVRQHAGAPGPWGDHAAADVVCSHNHDVLLAPHLLEAALAHERLAAEFLGVETPFMYSCNAFWTRPGVATRPDIQEFHRDADDVRFLPLFVLLTDVGDDGAQEIAPVGAPLRRVTGPAGTVFVSDTSQPHRGLRPRHAERGIAWFRWGVSRRPAAYGWDCTQPLPAPRLGSRYPSDQRLREMLEPLVR